MKILITGAAGNIGKRLAAALKTRAEILLVDAAAGDHIILDLTDERGVDAFIRDNSDITAVVHLAARAESKGRASEAESFFAINTRATEILAGACKKHLNDLQKFIFASSVAVYGEARRGEFEETDSLEPGTPYAASKRLAEDAVETLLPDKHYIFRFAPVYGPGFLRNLERRVRIGGRPFLVGNGGARLSLLHVENLVDTLVRLIEDDLRIPAGVYNLSDPQRYTYTDILDALKIPRNSVMSVPRCGILFLNRIGGIFGMKGMTENSSKLLFDHIYTSSKLSKYTSLEHSLTKDFS